MKTFVKIFYSLFLLFSFFSAIPVFSNDNIPKDWHLNEIIELENGYLEKSGGDPYIVFPEVDQLICSPKGILLSIKFDPPPLKPTLMELFWSTETLGFGEENKVFFILHPQNSDRGDRFIVPLDRTAVFTQIRLDFPEYIDTTFKIEEYEIISLDTPPKDVEFIDAYYNLSIKETLKANIFIPYFLKALKHGPQRLMHDKIFFLFWLSLIIFLLYLIRMSARKKPL